MDDSAPRSNGNQSSGSLPKYSRNDATELAKSQVSGTLPDKISLYLLSTALRCGRGNALNRSCQVMALTIRLIQVVQGMH